MAKYFKIPNEIQLKYDGRVHEGHCSIWHYLAGPELRVIYKGHSSVETLSQDADANQVAARLLEQLVLKNYVTYEMLDHALPPAIRKAAYLFVNELEDECEQASAGKSWEALIRSFDVQHVGSVEQKRASWLCLNALKAVVPAWTGSCDLDDVGQKFDLLLRHLQDGVPVQNWEALCDESVATRNGNPIVDCVACMVEPIAAGVANAARYLRSADVQPGGEAIFDAWTAQDEGAWNHKTLSFDQWVVFIALPAAYECREVADELIYG